MILHIKMKLKLLKKLERERDRKFWPIKYKFLILLNFYIIFLVMHA